MKYQLEKNTSIRWEHDGIYVMNSKYQTKTKILDEKKGRIFYEACHGFDIDSIKKVEPFLNWHFLEPLQPYEELISGNELYTKSPVYMTLGITSKCNYACKHCGNNSGIKKDSDLTNEKIYSLIKEMGNFSLLKLNFTGGEPTTHPELLSFMRYAKALIPRITLTTNGSNIDKEYAKRLKDAGLDMTKISLDGTKEFHNSFRRNDKAYELAIQAMLNLMEEGIEVRVQTTLTNDNVDDVIKTMELLGKLGISHQTIVPICPIGRASKDMMLSPEEYKKAVIKVYNKAKELEKTNTSYEIRPLFGAKELFEKGITTKLETLSLKYSCEALKNTMEIKPNGDVIPCSFLDFSIGNVKQSSIEEIWNQEQTAKIRDMFKQTKNNSHCNTCQNNSTCPGGCLANTYYYYNTVQEKDPYCFQYKVLQKKIGGNHV